MRQTSQSHSISGIASSLQIAEMGTLRFANQVVPTVTMDPFFQNYIAAWSGLCVVAVVLFLRRPSEFAIGRGAYWHFLGETWKVATFLAGAALITLFAPYSGDPTWDHIDGFFMSVFCFTTAPWVVATLFFSARLQATWRETYIAICAWLFSASWSYDIYLLWRDRDYPSTWFPNLFASSVIYLAAGMFWNLEWQRGRGVIFSFMRKDWPSRPEQSAFFKLIGYAAIFAVPAIAAVAMFLF